jgi:hypothetical protein
LSRPIRKTTKKAEEKTLSSEWRRRSALKKVLDTADIVRDVRFAGTTNQALGGIFAIRYAK